MNGGEEEELQRSAWKSANLGHLLILQMRRLVQSIQLTCHRSLVYERLGWGKTPSPISPLLASLFFTVTNFPSCSWNWDGEMAWGNSNWWNRSHKAANLLWHRLQSLGPLTPSPVLPQAHTASGSRAYAYLGHGTRTLPSGKGWPCWSGGRNRELCS